MPPPSDQTPAIAYGLYTEEPIRTPGGGLIMPDLPPEARERKAKLARLSESSSWAEIVLLDWFKRIAVFGVSASFDIERFERATQSLWRLTAIAKSIFALEDNPNRPIPAELQSEVDSILDSAGSPLGARASTPTEATSNPPATASSLTGSADAPVRNPQPTTDPAIDSTNSLGPQTASSATPLPASNPDNNQDNPSSPPPKPAPTADAPVSPTTNPSPTTPTDPRTSFSALRTPHSALEIPALPSLAVRAVPACPTLSLEGIETYLTRTESDLAEAKRPTPPILDLPPTPDKSHPSLPSPPSFSSLPSFTSFPAPAASPSPRSALATPPCTSPCPSSSPHSALATPRCIQCAEPFCASRIAVPYHHQPAVLKCDGTCRECSKTRACKFTPAYLRPG